MPDNSFYLVFGLTADPPHKGHEQVIINSYQFMKDQGLAVDQFDLVPTFDPNLIAGKKQPAANFEQRMTMCRIIADDLNKNHSYNVQVNDLEQQLSLQTGKKSYSYETLKAINHPNKLFVLSADHFSGRWPKFRKWHEWKKLVEENGLLIHQRPGHKSSHSFIEQLQDINPHVYLVTGYPAISISSSAIRKNFTQYGKNLSHLLDEHVFQSAKSKNIY